MKISVRDYKGVSRADIDLDRIALIAGQNEMGKTCVGEAARAALSGRAIPIAGVLKKDAKLLVRDGAESGYARAQNGESEQVARWPSATVVGTGDPIKCTDYASGFTHLLDLGSKERASVLAKYIDSEPTQEDVEAAARDAGYGDAAIAKIWESVRDTGYDVTYQRARDYTVKLKGQWEEATGEKKYGAKKGADWKPEVFGFDEKPVDLGDDRDALVEKVDATEQAVLDTAGAVAVSDAEIERLKRDIDAENTAENRIELNDMLVEPRDKLQKVMAERLAIPDDPEAQPLVSACPECGAALCVVDACAEVSGQPPVLKLYKPRVIDEVAIKAAGELRDALDEIIDEHKSEISELDARIRKVNDLISSGDTARTRLKEIEKTPKLDEVAIQKVKDEFSHARALVLAFDAKIRADKLHGDLVKNEKLIAILAPDGLRRRKLATKLDEFNARISTICASAAWPVVRVDEKLDCHYGTRPVWSASRSGQWRARAVIQIAMAMIDGSAAVILDEADMLDKRGRNGLFKALESSDVRAIVCMTFSSPKRVPDLEKAGFGSSFWISSGICKSLQQAIEDGD